MPSPIASSSPKKARLDYSHSPPLLNDTSQSISGRNYNKKGNVLLNRFLTQQEIYDIIIRRNIEHASIPPGIKNNTYFLINNKQNEKRRGNNKKSDFTDDCGIWDTNKSSMKRARYLVNNGVLSYIDKTDGKYC